MFVSAGRKNYANEALLFLTQHDFILSPRMAEQMLWSRFVNIRGVPGGNIPADLHNEHLNRNCKEAIKALGSNKTIYGVIRTGKALGTLSPTLLQFDKDNGIGATSGRHTRACTDQDRDEIVHELIKHAVFETHQRQQLKNIPKPRSLINKLSIKDIQEWIATHI